MKPIILFQYDEVRFDRLGCYGYKKDITPNIDRLAGEGVIFDMCCSTSTFTPVCTGTILCGVYPYIHGQRNGFQSIRARTLAQILREHGYKTAGFVSNGLIGSDHNYNAGFDCFDEPKPGKDIFDDTEKTLERYREVEHKEVQMIPYYAGSWYAERMFKWIRENNSSNFFVWCQFYETHSGSEKVLLKQKRIEEGVLSEHSYYDAKIKLGDEKIVGGIVETLEDLGLFDDTLFIVTSDHGTSLGDYYGDSILYHGLERPAHVELYDPDVHVPLIIKSKDLPKDQRVRGMVRHVDLVPTILELCGIPLEGLGLEGVSLVPFIKEGKVPYPGLEAYMEVLSEDLMGEGGARQGIRTDDYKYIRSLTTMSEEWFDLRKDPGENQNIIERVKNLAPKKLREIRGRLNGYLWKGSEEIIVPEEVRKRTEERLRALGYLK